MKRIRMPRVWYSRACLMVSGLIRWWQNDLASKMSPSFWIWQVPDGNCSGSTTMHYYVQESRCLAQRSRRKTGLICAACVPTKSTKGKQMRRTGYRMLTGNALQANSCIATTGTAIFLVFQRVSCSLIRTGTCIGKLQRSIQQKMQWMYSSAITTGSAVSGRWE